MSKTRSKSKRTDITHAHQRAGTSSVLVTLADQAYVEQAKQLFSSAYFDGGWRGDYLLLAHEIDEADLEWFEERGILVRRCEPLYEGSVGGMPPTLTSKFYMFTPEFRKWRTVIYCDADASICSSLDGLTSLQGFWSIQDASLWLERQIIAKESVEARGIDPARYKELVRAVPKTSPLRSPCFCAGFLAFTTDLIHDSTFQTLMNTTDRFESISQYGEQLIFNLVFAKAWRQLAPAYNMQVTGEDNQWHLPPEEVEAIALHYITADKPWLTKNAFYERWRRNLARADRIDLSAVPEVTPWSEQKITEHTAYLRRLEGSRSYYRLKLRWWFGRQLRRVPPLQRLYMLVRGSAGRAKRALKAFIRRTRVIKSQRPVTSTRYLLCTTPRTGSSLLCSLLFNTSIAGMRPDPVVGHEYLLEIADWDSPDIPLQEMGLPRIFQGAFERSSTGNGVSGFKLMWNQIDQLARRMPRMPDAAELSRRLPEHLPEGTRYIWLTRRDTVRQAVSWVKAMQSEAWDSRAEGSLKGDFRFRFDRRLIRKLHKQIRSENRGWRRFFRHQRIQPLQILYEEMIENPAATVGAILDYLDIPALSRVPANDYFLRQSNAVNEEWVQRFRDSAPLRRTLTRARPTDDRYPDFLAIGANRCGTTWLAEVLRSHPQIWVPSWKDIHYFDRSPDYPNLRTHAERKPLNRLAYADFRGRLLAPIKDHLRNDRWDLVRWDLRYFFGRWDDAWYASLFQQAEGAIAGDTTPDYSMLTAPDVRKVAELMPDARIIFVLRNPIERAWSHLRYDLGEPLAQGELSVVQMKDYVDSQAQELRSDYLRTIRHWSAAFPSEQLHIAFFDDLVAHPDRFARDVFRFLGVIEEPRRWKLRSAPVNASISHEIPDELRRYLTKKYIGSIEELAERFGDPPNKWLDSALKSISV